MGIGWEETFLQEGLGKNFFKELPLPKRGIILGQVENFLFLKGRGGPDRFGATLQIGYIHQRIG